MFSQQTTSPWFAIQRASQVTMILLAVAMAFLPFQPTQEAEAGVVGVIIVVVVVSLLIGECNEAGGSDSSHLPPVPEFVDVFHEESFLS